MVSKPGKHTAPADKLDTQTISCSAISLEDWYQVEGNAFFGLVSSSNSIAQACCAPQKGGLGNNARPLSPRGLSRQRASVHFFNEALKGKDIRQELVRVRQRYPCDFRAVMSVV